MEERKNSMKKLIAICAVTVLIAFTNVSLADWETFVIRQSSTGASPIIQSRDDVASGAMEFITFASSQKAAWGTNAVDGIMVGDLTGIGIDRLDDYTRFGAGSGPAVAPYFNIWITDGSGKYAVIANEPSNAEWQPGNNQWDITSWDMLKTKTLKVYENSDKSWLPDNGVGLTFEDVANYIIQAPTVAELTAGWAGLGGGAPRELGTNIAYGFNWMFGDTLSNYVSGEDGFIVANPTVVPEPATIALLTLGGLALLRRKSAQ